MSFSFYSRLQKRNAAPPSPFDLGGSGGVQDFEEVRNCSRRTGPRPRKPKKNPESSRRQSSLLALFPSVARGVLRHGLTNVLRATPHREVFVRQTRPKFSVAMLGPELGTAKGGFLPIPHVKNPVSYALTRSASRRVHESTQTKKKTVGRMLRLRRLFVRRAEFLQPEPQCNTCGRRKS